MKFSFVIYKCTNKSWISGDMNQFFQILSNSYSIIFFYQFKGVVFQLTELTTFLPPVFFKINRKCKFNIFACEQRDSYCSATLMIYIDLFTYITKTSLVFELITLHPSINDKMQKLGGVTLEARCYVIDAEI